MSQKSDDNEPHLDIAVEGGILTQAQADFYKIKKVGFSEDNYNKTSDLILLLSVSEFEIESILKSVGKSRGKGKNTNYGCQYGAGASTISRTAGVDLATAKKLVKAYKKLNWSINEIAKNQIRKTVSHGMYQWNPYSKMWYYLKTEKDSFSTLVQGSGSYLLDLWLKCIDNIKVRDGIKDELRLCMNIHDEQLQEYQSLTDEYVKDIFQEALDMVNKTLKVKIPFGCDTQMGRKYSEIH